MLSRRSLLVLVLGLVSPLLAAQETTTAPVSIGSAIEAARRLGATLLAAGAPGLSGAVAVDGEVVWAEGFGFADVERAIPVRTTTRFRVGSVAKPFTAAGLALLVEEGSLDLDAPIQTYVPSFPEKAEGRITTRLLAGHLAGIRHYRGNEFLSRQAYPRVTDGLTIFAKDPLLAVPGESFHYSTYAWTLVAAAIETAAEQEFLAFMDEHVFLPLGMHSTVADHATVVLPGRTKYYARRGEQLVVEPFVDNSYKWAGGGYLSTASDLVLYGSAHLAPGFLETSTLALLFTTQHTSEGEATGCGLAWFLEQDEQGRTFAFHTGGSVGGTTALLVHPQTGIAAAWTMNLSRGALGRQRVRELHDLFAVALER